LGTYFSVAPNYLTGMHQIIMALFQAGSANLKDLATHIPSAAKPESIYRGLQRFFAGVTLRDDEFIRFMVDQFVPQGEQIILAIDRTDWYFGETHHNILVISLIYQGCGIPLVIQKLPKSGNSCTQDRVAALKILLDLSSSLFLWTLCAMWLCAAAHVRLCTLRCGARPITPIASQK
jgi:hypothetical protein